MQSQPKYFFKFTQAYNDNGTVYYTMQIHTKGDDSEPIVIKTRYSQLRDLHEKCMQTQFKNDIPDFPHKKLLGNTKEDFIQKRKKQLQNYYNTLSKTVDIQKLVDLHKYIESHRKKKAVPQGQGKVIADNPNNNAVQMSKKQDQLKKTFENVYKDVLGQLTDLSGDFYPMASMPHDDSSKRFLMEIQQMKPQQSQLLSEAKVEGIEQNQTDFWSMFLKDEHEDFVNKSKNILKQFNDIQKSINSIHKQSIVLVK